MCPNCRAFITTDDKICPYCQFQMGAKAVEQRTPADALGGLIPHGLYTTSMILLVNAGLYLVTLLHTGEPTGSGLDMGSPDGRTLVAFGAMFHPLIATQWWRLITAGFLHGSALHILMNSWALFNLGPLVDQAFGTRRFLVIYLVSTVAGFLASFLYGTSLSVGASAGLCGLVGAMIAVTMRDKSAYGRAILSSCVQSIVLTLIMGFSLSFVDNAAHIGGVSGGFAIALVTGTPGFSASVESFWRFAAGAAMAITAVAFLMMFLQLSSLS
jgi:rhomboid protease GluP